MTKRNYLAIFSRPAEMLITLFLSVFLVAFMQLIVIGLLWLYTYEKPSPSKLSKEPKHDIENAGKLFLPDGTLHLVYRLDTQHYDDFSKEQITDVNGQIIWQGPRKEKPFKYLDWSTISGSFAERQMESLSQLTPDLSSVLEVPVWSDRKVQEVWRYDSKSEAFKGYNLETGPIGFLGADGFENLDTRPLPFGKFKNFDAWTDENPASPIMLWQTARQIYQIDFRNRTVELLFESNQADINSIEWHQWRQTNPKDLNDSGIQYRPLLCCLTADNKYHFILREPNQTITIDRPQQWRISHLAFTATAGNVFLEYTDTNFYPPEHSRAKLEYVREYRSKPQPCSIQLYKAAADGKLQLVNRFDWIKPKSEQMSLYNTDRMTVFLTWVRKVSPPAFDLLAFLFGDGLHTLAYERQDLIMTQAYAQLIIEWKPDMNLLSYALILIVLAITIWHGWARRTSWPKLIFWLAVIALFGISGLLAYLALNYTPVIKCPVCGKKRGLETPICIRCANTLPAPKPKPTDLIMAS